MTIYQLLHLVLLISLFGCAAGLTCAIIYFVRIRATPPSASAHRTSCANLQHLLAGCARWGCAAAMTDMLVCAALWLTASRGAEAGALRQLFSFAHIALIGGAACRLMTCFAAFALREEDIARRILRPARLLCAALMLAGVISITFLAFVNL